jgi:hypothetical protein
MQVSKGYHIDIGWYHADINRIVHDITPAEKEAAR